MLVTDRCLKETIEDPLNFKTNNFLSIKQLNNDPNSLQDIDLQKSSSRLYSTRNDQVNESGVSDSHKRV